MTENVYLFVPNLIGAILWFMLFFAYGCFMLLFEYDVHVRAIYASTYEGLTRVRKYCGRK